MSEMARRIAEYTVNILVVLAIFISFFFILGSRFLGIDFFTIYTGSMQPSLPIGSVVMVRPVDITHLDVGDVIAFKAGTRSETVVHRVIEVITGNPSVCVRTAGDANTSPDSNPVLAENIVGKVFSHIPFLGYLSDFVRTKLGYFLLVVLPAIFIISLEIRNIIKELQSMKTPVPEGKPG